jgi:hypothetical protein
LKRLSIILAVTAIAVAAAPFVSIGGTRLIGFRYGVFTNNATTVCRDRVVAQNGTTITLSDDRSFQLQGIDPETLTMELKDAEHCVLVDTSNGVLYGRFQRAYCGFDRPQSCQLITIPLIRKDLPSHGMKPIAGIAQASTPPGGR